MYVIDTTGSMDSIRATVADTVAEFTERLMAAGAADIYFGAAFFGDFDRDDPWFGIELELGAHDFATVSDALENLTTTDGGDAPEDAVWAYMRAINETAWRADSQRVVVLITDEETKTRSTVEVGGYPVTLEGAFDITASNDIKPALVSYENPYGHESLSDLADLLGVPEYLWSNHAELLSELTSAVIPPTHTLEDCLCEAKVESVTYVSDGEVSTDVSVSISPANLVVPGGETKKFNLSAVGSASPARDSEDETVVEIGFYVDGTRVGSATQFIYYNAEAEETVGTLPPEEPVENPGEPESVPLVSGGKATPSTGDKTNSLPWATLATLSIIVLLIATERQQSRNLGFREKGQHRQRAA
jgi:hypothetical protein